MRCRIPLRCPAREDLVDSCILAHEQSCIAYENSFAHKSRLLRLLFCSLQCASRETSHHPDLSPRKRRSFAGRPPKRQALLFLSPKLPQHLNFKLAQSEPFTHDKPPYSPLHDTRLQLLPTMFLRRAAPALSKRAAVAFQPRVATRSFAASVRKCEYRPGRHWEGTRACRRWRARRRENRREGRDGGGYKGDSEGDELTFRQSRAATATPSRERGASI